MLNGVVPTDLEIAQAATLRPLPEIGAILGLAPEDLEPYGRHVAKVELDAVGARRPAGRYVVVTAITPTPLGEGKTTTAVGLTQGLGRLGLKATVAGRPPPPRARGGGEGGGGGAAGCSATRGGLPEPA